jgi:hypothetical protein
MIDNKSNEVEMEDIEDIKPNFSSEIDKFIKHIEAQTDIVPLVMSLLSIKLVQESKHVDKYIKENGLLIESEDNSETKNLSIPAEKINEFIKLNEKVDTTNLAYNLLPINFVVSFVSQYDAYLGGLIRVMFLNKPEMLNSSEKNIMFSELLKFSSIEEAQEFVVEKEVESVLRESHIKQFKWLENKLGITLRKDLSSFSDFIEITERRNLFVHCNGKVSRQYIENCNENQVKDIDKIKIGDILNAKPAYFSKCYLTLFEIGVKLGHVMWRKLKPEENDEADAHLINITYELLIKGHFKLAINLLTFATDTFKKHTQETICVLTINKALAFYLSDKKIECKKVIEKHDWSATNDKFKLAVSVLLEKFTESIELMKSIGNNNEHLNKEAYRDWPLFSDFRKTTEFKNTYKEIFDEDLIYIETKPRDLEDILYELKQLKKESADIENEEVIEDAIEEVIEDAIEVGSETDS